MMNSHFLVPGPACAVGGWAPSCRHQSSAQGAKNAHQRKEPTPVGPDTGRDTRLLRMSPALREPRIEALTRLHKASWAHVWARRRIRCATLRIGDGDHYTCTWPLESHLTPRGSGLGIVFILVRAAQRYCCPSFTCGMDQGHRGEASYLSCGRRYSCTEAVVR